MSASPHDLLREAESRLERLAADAQDGALDPAIALLVDALRAGGVIQAFGTGHSEAFAMEIAGRAGGLIPTKRIALRDIVLHGDALRGRADRVARARPVGGRRAHGRLAGRPSTTCS